jgi:hypothetical protein
VTERTDYWRQTRRPLLSLLMLLPLLLFYETAALLFHVVPLTTKQMLEAAMEMFGGHARLLPGVIVVVVLLLWHLIQGDRGRVRGRHLLWMFVESLVWAPVLLPLNAAVAKYVAPARTVAALTGAAAGGADVLMNKLVNSIGAGIYEELVFRLLLVGAGGWVLFRCGMRREAAGVLMVLISAAVFSWMHFWGGDPFTMFAFVWRAVAGIYLGALFMTRGFGITVMAHAFFNVIVHVLSAFRAG